MQTQGRYLIALVTSADMRLKVRIHLKCPGTSGHSFFLLFIPKQNTDVDLYLTNPPAYSGFCLRGDSK